jgi:transposase-like protein
MKEKKDEVLRSLLEHVPEDFFARFKTMGELNTFMDSFFKRGIEKMLEAELNEHLGYTKYSPEGKGTGNSRNGKGRKLLKSQSGEVVIEVPRDRNSSFEPLVVPKRQGVIDKIESIIISLYARGMSVEDISAQIKDIYGVSISPSSISNITDQVLSDVDEWQKRALDATYLIVWLDGISIKVRNNGKIINKSVYLIIGLNTLGKKEVIGMWMHETESASFWMNVLNDLKVRGVQDILIACSDNLKGLTQAIKAIFPQTVTQLCIVHQIRNTMRYIASKDKRTFMADLKKVYNAINEEQAQENFNLLEVKWEHKYPYAIKSWIANWNELTSFLKYPLELRHIIYTTNIIENLNRNIRKFTKNKTMFPDDDALRKAVYLALKEATFKWSATIYNWALIANQLNILFPDRCKLSLISLDVTT